MTLRAALPAATPSPLLGGSPALRALRAGLERAARSDATVLITGETGTGKGLVARELHRLSRRAAQPFVVADCAGLAPALLESELFGHERGAFTGALAERAGRFDEAGAGTLFLDEIGELPLPLQARLLRALQDREFERVGSNRSRQLRARVVAATHRDLAREVEAGAFRADLFFRLHVVQLRVPALRERAEDIAELAQRGLARIAARGAEAGSPPIPLRLGAAALARLAAHDWPGNVRELLNLLERLWLAAAPAGAELEAADVERALREHPVPRPQARMPAPPAASAWLLRSAREAGEERAALLLALEQSRGNVARAARALGLPRSTLRYRMQQHGLG